MRRLLLFAAFTLLLALPLAACDQKTPPTFTPTPAPPTATATASPSPTITPSPTATLPPTPTPLPPGLGWLLPALTRAWHPAELQVAPAPAEETARLAAALEVSPEDLGQVYRVEADGTVFYASAETGQSYALRQKPDVSNRPELNGLAGVENMTALDGSDEVLTVERVRELNRWGKVIDAGDAHLWRWNEEENAWEKVPFSGYDPETRLAVVEHFLEVTGYPDMDTAAKAFLAKGYKSFPDVGIDPYYAEMLLADKEYSIGLDGGHGMNLGAGWLHTELQASGKKVDALVIYLAYPSRHDDAFVVPVVGFFEDGVWKDTMTRIRNVPNGYVMDKDGFPIRNEEGERLFLPIDDPELIEALFAEEDNLGARVFLDDLTVANPKWLRGEHADYKFQPSQGQREWVEEMEGSLTHRLSFEPEVLRAWIGENPFKALATGEVDAEVLEKSIGVTPEGLRIEGDKWNYEVLVSGQEGD